MGHKHSKYAATADLFGAAASVLDSLVTVQQDKLNQELEMHKIKVSERQTELDRLHAKELDTLDFLQETYTTAKADYKVQKKDYGHLENLPIESAGGKKMQEIAQGGYSDPVQLENAISMLGAITTAKETQINSFDTGKLLYQAVDFDQDGTATGKEVDAFLEKRRKAAEADGKTFMIDPSAFRRGVEVSLSTRRERLEEAAIKATGELTVAKTKTEEATQEEITARARMLNAQAAKEEHLNKGLPSEAQMEIMNQQTIDMADVKIQGAMVDVDAVRKNMELVSAQVGLKNVEIEKIAGEVAQANYLQNKDTYEWTRTRLDATMLYNNEKQGEIATATAQILGYYDRDKTTWKPFLSILTSGREAVALGDPGALQDEFSSIAKISKFASTHPNSGDFIGIGENGELKRLFNSMYLSGIGDPSVTAIEYKTLPPAEMIQSIASIYTEYSPMAELESSVDKAFATYYADKKSKKMNDGSPLQAQWDKMYKKSFDVSRQGNDFGKFLRSDSSPFQDSTADTYFRYEQWKHTGFFSPANEHMLNSAVAVYNQKIANDGLIEKLVTRGVQWGMQDTEEIYGKAVSLEPVSPVFKPIK